MLSGLADAHQCEKGQGDLPLEPPPAPNLPKDLLVARTSGIVEWMCPACGRLRRSKPSVNGRVECDMLGCRRIFLIGFSLASQLATLPPFNGFFNDRASVRASHNVPEGDWELLAACRPLVARLAGPLEHRCPSCGDWNYQYPDWSTGGVSCRTCRVDHYVRVILHAAAPFRITAPIDWTSYVQTAFPRRQRLGALGSRGRRLRRFGIQQGGLRASGPASEPGGVDGRPHGVHG